MTIAGGTGVDYSEETLPLAGQKRLVISSSKGGIGKSTISAGLATSLAARGRKVLLIDMDCGNGSLDLMLGAQDDVVYNWGDLALSRCSADAVLLRLADQGGLLFAAAPTDMVVLPDSESGDVTPDGRTVISRGDMLSSLEELCSYTEADYVICDTAAGIDIPLMLAGGFTDMALIASSHQPSSMRAAENTAVALEGAGIRWIRMIISAFELSGAYNEKRAGLIDIIDNAHVRIIGVVPYDRSLMLAHEHGVAAAKDAPSSRAFSNIADRLEGKQVKLFNKVKGIAKRKIY